MKLKSTCLTLFSLLTFATAQAQVKVGANPGTINAGSALEIEATNKGLLMPRISLSTTTTWGLAGTAAAGMSVYNTNAGLTSTNTTYPAMGVGEYYWDGTGWVSKKSGAQLGGDNGLTVGYNSTGNVGLGGTLAKNTDVATDGKIMSFSGSGYVGVGTTAPKSKLSLSSDGGGMLGADDFTIYTYGTSVAPSIIEMSAAGTEAIPANITNGTPIGSLGFGGRWNNAWNGNVTNIIGSYRGDGTTTLSDLRFSTSYVERMRIEPAGNVGIGTANPGAKLEVNSGSTAGAIKLVDGTQGAGKVLTSDANGVGTWQAVASSVNAIYQAIGTSQVTVSAGNTSDIPGTQVSFTTTSAQSTVLITATSFGTPTAASASSQGTLDIILDGNKVTSSYWSGGDLPNLVLIPFPTTVQQLNQVGPGSHTIKLQAKTWHGSVIFNTDPVANNYAGALPSDTNALKSRVSVLVLTQQ